jgi:protein-arginine kinase
MLVTQPGHLQKLLGRSTSPEERDEARARILRDSVRAAVEG